MRAEQEEWTVVEWYLGGLLDEASGLPADVLDGVEQELGDLVDGAGSFDAQYNSLAVQLVVRDTVREDLAQVLEACGADEWMSNRPRSLSDTSHRRGAHEAIVELRSIHAECETVIERAACHHAL